MSLSSSTNCARFPSSFLPLPSRILHAQAQYYYAFHLVVQANQVSSVPWACSHTVSTQASGAKQADRKQNAEAKHKADIKGLFVWTSNLVTVSWALTALPLQDEVLVDQMLTDCGVSDNDMPLDPPLGEEAFDFSHEGGEHEAFASLAQQVESLSE